ncbi:hypothetical protein LTR36_005781 [Oleoguttula mirabilis]|uniref:Uncharacterized protein n=1 Tax=Oleoguttula mirabilis TaxID=1507867 RepID=A0AAV9JFF7_9PEZI|nr:hypothetical protein LTR36_005781 [Oleoguttula mirabilis]
MAVSATRPAVSAQLEPRSRYVADSTIQAFLQPDFDPADYLNSTLPALSASSSARSAQNTPYGRAVPLPELSSQLQTLLSQLNAQTTRLSNTLTQLTDEILRSGGRLAYEVEVLRGDTGALTDALDHGLKKEIELLVPQVASQADRSPEAHGSGPVEATEEGRNEPEYLGNLRALTAVRSRLDGVIKVFGDAMAWPVAPSELPSGVASSLISVSAPEFDAETRSREEKAKEYAEKLRNEINEMVGSGNDMPGLEAAATRLDELQQLAEVWKGTAEAPARLKLLESMQKPIEERQKLLERAGQSRRPAASPSRVADYRFGNPDASRAASEGGYGFLSNLRKLKDDMYLD